MAEQELSGGQAIVLPLTITAAVLVIEATASESGEETVPGYARAIASFSDDSDPFESVDFDRVSISLTHPQLFEVTQRFVNSYKLELVLYEFIPFPVTVRVWAIDGAELPLGGGGQNSGGGGGEDRSSDDCVLSGELIDFVPMPSGDGLAVSPGLAVFTAGEAEFQVPSTSQPDYHQQYSVRGDYFWGVGVRSLNSYSEGRFSFVSGTGRSILGLTAVFPEVDFKLLDWAWYIHAPDQVFAFEREPGKSIRSAGEHPWSPDQSLSLAIADQKIQYGIGDSIVYESPIPVQSPLYFAAVLGPQAFVVNCLRS